jgi:hypothetical protein
MQGFSLSAMHSESIACNQLPGKEGFYGEITDQQRRLYTALGVTPPA